MDLKSADDYVRTSGGSIKLRSLLCISVYSDVLNWLLKQRKMIQKKNQKTLRCGWSDAIGRLLHLLLQQLDWFCSL